MINVSLLKAKIMESGYTQKEFCKKIKMAESTFIRKMKTGDFTLPEAEMMIEILDIENPIEVFFGG